MIILVVSPHVLLRLVFFNVAFRSSLEFQNSLGECSYVWVLVSSLTLMFLVLEIWTWHYKCLFPHGLVVAWERGIFFRTGVLCYQTLMWGNTILFIPVVSILFSFVFRPSKKYLVGMLALACGGWEKSIWRFCNIFTMVRKE